MNDLVVNNYDVEFDLFDRSLYPFYKDTELNIYSNIQEMNINKIVNHLMKASIIKEVVEAQMSSEPVKFLAANIDKHTQSMIDTGKWILKVSKTNKGFNPTLVDKSGKFVKQLSLESKEIGKNMNGNNLQHSLSNIYLQQQMQEIMEQLEMLNSTLQRVERGQLDDRIGLYLSAKQQFLEALNMENETLKQIMMSNAIKSANDARFQLMQSAYSNIKLVIQPNKSNTKTIDNQLNNIRESMQYINEATQLCVSAYSAQNEEKAQVAVLQSYQNFIETAFLEETGDRVNAEILHTNWEGADSGWLEFPKKLNESIQGIVSERKLYLESGEGNG